jgi:hypothetical protein
VVTVEHDHDWAMDAALRAGVNQVIVHIPRGAPLESQFARRLPSELPDREAASYAAEPLRYPEAYFDAICIDGIARVPCAWVAMQAVSPHGFILFDNSDRQEYAMAYGMLHEAGFARVDYWGTGPVNPYEWCTSLFMRYSALKRFF